MYIIVNSNDVKLVWKEGIGWVEDIPEGDGQPTVYDQRDLRYVSLPSEGEWLEI